MLPCCGWLGLSGCSHVPQHWRQSRSVRKRSSRIQQSIQRQFRERERINSSIEMVRSFSSFGSMWLENPARMEGNQKTLESPPSIYCTRTKPCFRLQCKFYAIKHTGSISQNRNNPCQVKHPGYTRNTWSITRGCQCVGGCVCAWVHACVRGRKAEINGSRDIGSNKSFLELTCKEALDRSEWA